MPSKVRQIQFRLPWLRKSQGDRADSLAKAILSHPEMKEKMEFGRCPICGKLFDDCEYFQRLDDE
jgi:hypothetical protein